MLFLEHCDINHRAHIQHDLLIGQLTDLGTVIFLQVLGENHLSQRKHQTLPPSFPLVYCYKALPSGPSIFSQTNCMVLTLWTFFLPLG